ncbi:MAG: matrixin family metalloprotease, partial [Planctomycetota bacterium]
GIVATVEGHYAAFDNISFTTVKPMGGQYATVFIGGNLSPDRSTGGIADSIDTNNSNLADMAVVFGGEIATNTGRFFGQTLDTVAVVLGNVASHELGHILGLNHVNNSLTLPDTWIMSYPNGITHWSTDDMVFTTHERLMSDAGMEFFIGYQNSVASLWSIA